MTTEPRKRGRPTGYKHKPETKEKLSVSNRNRAPWKLSEETKQKMRKPKSDTHRENMSKASKGKPKSAAHKAALSASQRARNAKVREALALMERMNADNDL